MIWYSRYNAILVIFLIIGIALSITFESPNTAIWTIAIVILVRVGVWIINLVNKVENMETALISESPSLALLRPSMPPETTSVMRGLNGHS